MVDKILCPHCNKLNEVHKFCIYCGGKLLKDNEFKLITQDTDPICLNCGRPVEKNQTECECGYKFWDITCPDCNSINEYANKFCTSCGNRLWRTNISYFKYSQSLFENHIFNKTLPYHLRNISLYERPKNKIGKNPVMSKTLHGLKTEDLKVNENLIEICSRWKIISPNYCIKCHKIIDSSEYSCPQCNNDFADKTRVDFIKTNRYIEPKFDDINLKWTSKNKGTYLSSLSPTFGESQFEYRERLKWEFAENSYYHNSIKTSENRIKEYERKRKEKEKEKREREIAWERSRKEYERKINEKLERIREAGGWYCGSSCYYYYEEYTDSNGGITIDLSDAVGFYYYCRLGHTVSEGRFCEDYKMTY